MFMFVFVVSFVFFVLAVKDGCALLTVEWKASDNRTMHVDSNSF